MSVTIDGSSGIGTPGVSSTGAVSGTTGTFSGEVRAQGLSTPLRPLVRDTAKTATGNEIDFTGIPDWVTRITIVFDGVSLSTTDSILVQPRVGGVPVTTGYKSISGLAGANFNITSTSGFIVYAPNTAGLVSGSMVLHRISGNRWVSNHSGGLLDVANAGVAGGGHVDAGGTVDGVRITRTGTNTFDAGTINVFYE